MRRARALALIALLALAGCGGDSQRVPSDAVAVVDGEEISRGAYDELVTRTKKSYENQDREFPKTGSTEFQALKSQFVQYLVQREQMRQEAEELGVAVTEEQIEERLTQVKEQYFEGDEKRYESQLRDSGLTDEQVRADIRDQIVSERIFESVTQDAKVTDAAVEKHYAENEEQYSQPESRQVRHILVKTKAKADDLYAQLRAGGDFDELAKANSEDSGSKDNGGKLTISRGQTVAAFDKRAFELAVNEVSRPVQTEFGFHLIEALGPVQAAKVTPLKDVRDAIEQQLLQAKKNEKMAAWVDDLDERYEGKVDYQTGFAPATTGAATTAATTTR